MFDITNILPREADIVCGEKTNMKYLTQKVKSKQGTGQYHLVICFSKHYY